jgi:hypothetical protein
VVILAGKESAGGASQTQASGHDEAADDDVLFQAELGCMLSRAAGYFPGALKQWNEQYNSEGRNQVGVPNGLTVTKGPPHRRLCRVSNRYR